MALVLSLAVAGPAQAGSPDAVLERLSAAFRESRARDLRPLLAKDRKLYLAVPAIQKRAALVGADQAYYLLRDFFEQHPTRSFRLERHASTRAGELTVRADWHFEGPGLTREGVSLSFTLIDGAHGWVLSEIRAADS